MKKRKLTPEQEAARDARRLKFKALWKQVAAMPESERLLIACKLGLVTCDGHPLSPGNQYLIFLQCPAASVLGGFRQWRKHGRSVRKGQHGAMIWVPCGGKKNEAPLDGSRSASAVADGEPAGDSDSRFIVGTLFDISQTEEIIPGKKFTPDMTEPEEQEAPAPSFSPAMVDPEPAAELPATEPSPEPMPANVAQPQDGFLF